MINYVHRVSGAKKALFVLAAHLKYLPQPQNHCFCAERRKYFVRGDTSAAKGSRNLCPRDGLWKIMLGSILPLTSVTSHSHYMADDTAKVANRSKWS
jgi:hypothetical protein